MDVVDEERARKDEAQLAAGTKVSVVVDASGVPNVGLASAFVHQR